MARPRRGDGLRRGRGRPGAHRQRRSRVRHRARGVGGARTSLRFFRQATILAVAITALLLMLLGEGGDAATVQQPAALPDTVSIIEDVAVDDLQRPPEEAHSIRPDTLVAAARDEAIRTIRDLWYGLLTNLPKFLVAGFVLALAGFGLRILRPLLARATGHWERASATTAIVGIVVWAFAIGVAISVIAGDIRALVGSLGLIGLALSWALQTPIESFTGWLLNSFQGYYRVGDRIAVGEIFGDVYQIDFLTTTVWEIGSPDRPGFVNAEQPTGRLITFPNNEVLAGSIVNLTRDFPYVWDEVALPIANRSDLVYAVEVVRRVTASLIESEMRGPAATYTRILQEAGLDVEVSGEVQVFVDLAESWTTLTARYLVEARRRRKWKSELSAALAIELNSQEHADRILPVFPRRQIQIVGRDGKVRDPTDTLADVSRRKTAAPDSE